jgi:hypothetical protein
VSRASSSVARVRGAALERDVPVLVAGDRARERRSAHEAVRARVHARLGLAGSPGTAAAEAADPSTAHAFAFYDPARGAIVVTDANLPGAVREQTLLHEVCHALQDQRFGLESLRRDALAPGDSDPENALAMLVEGDASFTTLVATLANDGVPASVATELVLAEAELSREQRLDRRARDAERMGARGEPIRAAVERARRLPLYAYRTVLDPHAPGAAFVATLVRRGGWEAVDAVFRGPPLATEQVLHPEKLFAGERHPRATLPDLARAGVLADAHLVHEDVLGELGISTLVRERLGPGRDQVASGWAGDRLQAYERGDRLVLVWTTRWDTDDDAREAEAALAELARSDPGRGAGEVAGARRSGANVAFVLGAREEELERVLAHVLR